MVYAGVPPLGGNCRLKAEPQRIGNSDTNGTPTGSFPATGGGIANYTGSTLTIRDSTFRENVARGSSSTVGIGGSALGGTIQNNASALMLIDSTVADNVAFGGSGLRDGLAAGGGIDDSTKPGSSQAATASIVNSDFRSNQAIGGDGVAAANGREGVGSGIAGGSYALLFSGYLDPGTLSATDSTIAHNTAQGGDGGHGANGGDRLGGGVAVQAASAATVSDSAVKHKEADGGHKGVGGVDGLGVGGGVYSLLLTISA